MSQKDDLFPLPEGIKEKTWPCYFTKREIGGEFIKIHQGPTKESNWLIPGKILMSGYPFNRDEEVGIAKLKKIIEGAGITVFVTLQTERELKRFKDFKPHAKKINEDCIFLSHGMPDQCAPDNIEDTKKVVDEVLKLVEGGRKCLIHCWGGSGRTGLLSSCILSERFPEMSLSQIFTRVQVCANTRVREKRSIIPHTFEQRKHVADYISFYDKENGEKRIDLRDFK